MRYRYFVDFRLGISVFANFSYGIAVSWLPLPPPPPNVPLLSLKTHDTKINFDLLPEMCDPPGSKS